jgi:RHS repeat-associated protein
VPHAASGRRTAFVDEGRHRWQYEYDEQNQLISALARFDMPPPALPEPVPGLQLEYGYDDIGNRRSASNLGVNGQPPLHEGYTSNALNQYTMIANPRTVLISGEADPAQSVFVGLDTLDPQNLTTADRGPAPNNQHRYFARLQAPQQSTNDQATVHDVNILALPGWISTYRTLVPASEQTLTYDLDGNLASDGLWTYRYDAENRLIRMRMHPHLADWLLNKSGQTDPAWLELRFMYDHQHRRVGKLVLTSQQNPSDVKDDTDAEYTFSTSYFEKYLYDTGTFNLLVSFRADPQTGEYGLPGRSYHWGPDLSGTLTGAGGIGGLAMTQDLAHDAVNALDPIGPMFAVYDGHGNLTRLYDSSRTLMAAYEYAPFGEVRSIGGLEGQGNANPFRFSTKFADAETGLSYYGYRFYSAQMGRWVNRDPIEERGGNNLTAFVGNNPIGLFDALGLHPQSDLQYCDKSCSFPSLLPQLGKSTWQDFTHAQAGLLGGWRGSAQWATLPGAGTTRVTKELSKVYRYYASLYAEDDSLLWAGAASTVGAGLIPGIATLDWYDSNAGTFGPEPGQIRTMLIRVAQDIFDDMAWQHRAYLDAGLGELRAHLDTFSAGPLQRREFERLFYNGWCVLARGGDRNQARAMLEFARYEQSFVAQPEIDRGQPITVYGQTLLALMERALIPIIPGSVGFYTANPNGSFTNLNDRLSWMQSNVLIPWALMSRVDRAYIVGGVEELYSRWIHF